MMRALVLLVLLLASFPARAQVPTCAGTDLLDELQKTDPALWQGVVNEAKKVSNGQARLWRIERAGVAPSYLLGTLHSTDPRITALSPALEKALAETRTIALEIANPSPTAMMEAFKTAPSMLIYTDGHKITPKLSPEEMKVVRARLEGAGLSPELVMSLRPWFAYTLLALPDCERERQAAGIKVLDVALAEQARRRGHAVVGLETVREQLAALSGIPEAEQIVLLRLAVAWSARAHDVLESVQQRYLKREIGAAWQLHLALAEKAGLRKQTFSGFLSKVLTERNLVMRDRSLRLLAKGRALIAVGAMHLVGEQGLVALYQKAGYTLVAV